MANLALFPILSAAEGSKIMPEYTDVPSEVINIAQDMIHQYHSLLEDCNIGFVFRDEASTSGGKTVLASTRKVSDMIKPLLSQELDILVVIAEDQWVLLSNEQRRALIDHELCHITPTKNCDGWTTRAHDIEEFQEILDRYGLWKGDLFMAGTSMAKAVQLKMSITSAEKTPNGAVIQVDAEKFNQVLADLDNQKEG
jgi:hypothetical protein